MGYKADSFDSNGWTVVSFETTNTEGLPTFGVSVASTTCGVYGRTVDSAHDTRTAPTNTGVFGRSTSHGVYGITNSISDADTPDFTKVGSFYGITFSGAGVIGVSNSHGPAVLADNGVIGVNVTYSKAIDYMCRVGCGVASISVEGPAILGLCCKEDPRADPELWRIIDGLLPWDPQKEEPNLRYSGVIGVGTLGPGVRGVSVNERGGVFQSRMYVNRPLAQIRLVPTKLQGQLPPIEPKPPDDEGEAGDLLVINYRDARNTILAALFFCTEGVSTAASAHWVRLA